MHIEIIHGIPGQPCPLVLIYQTEQCLGNPTHDGSCISLAGGGSSVSWALEGFWSQALEGAHDHEGLGKRGLDCPAELGFS